MKNTFFIIIAIATSSGFSQFAPAAGEPGSTAIHKDSTAIVNWATKIENFSPGRTSIEDLGSPLASYGVPENALGVAEGSSVDIVSLGDLGSITLGFAYPIKNGPGNDFAVFENSFSDTYLEFAHVEVSTDGINFVRFSSVSNIPTVVQTATYATSDPTLVHNLAGKYRQGYGTPFDLEELIGIESVNVDSINFVRIIDVVGSINSDYATLDGEGNIINDPYPSNFESGGFDLDAVAVLNENNPFAGLDDYIYENQFKIYPNPSSGVLYFSNVERILSVSIFTLTGEFISEFQLVNLVNLEELNLTNGIYLLHVLTVDNELINKKIVYKSN